MEATLGLVGFWFLEVNSLLFVYMLFNFFLSGHMFPLDMVGEPYKTLLFFNFASSILGVFPRRVCSWENSKGVTLLAKALLIEAAWVVFFFVLARWLYYRGLKRYSGYGG